MSYRRQVFFMLLVLVLWPLVLTVTAQESEEVERTGLRPDAPPYAIRGEYWVGTRDFIIDPSSERPLSISVWYPALNPDNEEESFTYTDVVVKFEPPSDLPPTLIGHALAEATANLSDGPYPLIINSGGFGTYRQSYAYSTEHLASHGFVVIAPDHIERFDAPEPGKNEMDRIKDVFQVIQYAEELTAENGMMAGMIDTNNIAVMGNSSGGFTSFAVGGARIDFDQFRTRCEGVMAGDPHYDLCYPFVELEAEMAALAGFDPVPEGLWPSWSDPRIKAIVPIVGDSDMFGPDGLNSITIPMMVITGTNDSLVPPDWGAYLAYEFASSENKALVAFESADHFTFWSKCEDQPWLTNWFWACSDAVWDMDRAHDLVNHFTTAFLLAELYDDADAAAALSSDAVGFPGITYQTTGF